ncbi:hypothetical protein CYMTET_15170 [Cymbomonas tetramitiformis]|uniref:Uncharacterized protein n=1 Tax=Cymbomonas tetramitiformis TaxID=36881 RepID=A0AAE0GF35_9CHLO|nr:hypothetical protein CYMTET_15170 [Cymbomonas tetramitiformis]
MPSGRQVTARLFYAEALLERVVHVPAGSFNAEWTKPAVRAELNIPEYYVGTVKEYIQGQGPASTDRWKIVYDDGDETGGDLPHVTLSFIKSYVLLPFPEVPGAASCDARVEVDEVDEEDVDGDIDTDDDEEGDLEDEEPAAGEDESAGDMEEHEFTGFGQDPMRFKWSSESDEISQDQRITDGVGVDLKPPKLNWDAQG